MHNVTFKKEIEEIEKIIKKYCKMKECDLWQKLELNKKLLYSKRFVFENESLAQLLSKFFYSNYHLINVTVNEYGIHITISNGTSGYQLQILFSFVDINRVLKDMKGYFEWVKEVIDSVFVFLEKELQAYYGG